MRSITDLGVPPSPNGKEVFTPPSRAAWRSWLATNNGREHGLWIVYRKKTSPLFGPDYDDLVEEALCFGWIDSQLRRVDGDRQMQWFSPRRPRGIWSATNKARIARLAAEGQIAEAGWKAIDQAKTDGSWSQTDDVDALVIPPDLEAALDATPGARAGYLALSDSAKRQYLWWIHSAKRNQTRADRIVQTIESLISDGASES